jgi:hypothetical protein
MNMLAFWTGYIAARAVRILAGGFALAAFVWIVGALFQDDTIALIAEGFRHVFSEAGAVVGVLIFFGLLAELRRRLNRHAARLGEGKPLHTRLLYAFAFLSVVIGVFALLVWPPAKPPFDPTKPYDAQMPDGPHASADAPPSVKDVYIAPDTPKATPPGRICQDDDERNCYAYAPSGYIFIPRFPFEKDAQMPDGTWRRVGMRGKR